jgi:hypothetical protein
MMRHITQLPTDIILYIGEFCNDFDEPCYERYILAAILNDMGTIQHYFYRITKEEDRYRSIILNDMGTIQHYYYRITEEDSCQSTILMACGAYAGNLAMVQWLHQNGSPWNSIVFKKAAGGGNLDVVLSLGYLDMLRGG